jgi:hypothetical protein
VSSAQTSTMTSIAWLVPSRRMAAATMEREKPDS